MSHLCLVCYKGATEKHHPDQPMYNAWPHLRQNSGFHDAFEEILKSAKVLITEGKMPQVVKKAFSDLGIPKS
ncbi:hypothetical protein CN324_29345 [Bacillus anthracis]|nr:hypothetical protein CON50_27170 [Bacillus anthracis]PGZ97265.1 hypothetical protein COE65_30480 [Bacillus sp. AFS051223]PEF62771.1 hypothetical protein CON33_27770 [Bacillus anthracis]PFA96389.1 hypothetical protein CN385_23230 [Bacillus anthracis]PFF13028.1 hypothetical protein CN324_29345 [Bacillus anthracis]